MCVCFDGPHFQWTFQYVFETDGEWGTATFWTNSLGKCFWLIFEWIFIQNFEKTRLICMFHHIFDSGHVCFYVWWCRVCACVFHFHAMRCSQERRSSTYAWSCVWEEVRGDAGWVIYASHDLVFIFLLLLLVHHFIISAFQNKAGLARNDMHFLSFRWHWQNFLLTHKTL